jgi:hypothetical protein
MISLSFIQTTEQNSNLRGVFVKKNTNRTNVQNSRSTELKNPTAVFTFYFLTSFCFFLPYSVTQARSQEAGERRGEEEKIKINPNKESQISPHLIQVLLLFMMEDNGDIMIFAVTALSLFIATWDDQSKNIRLERLPIRR